MSGRGTRAGFTLVELMVVLAIMGITVGLAVPTMSSAIADRRVGMVARDIVRIYRQARYSSMAYGRAHGVAFQYGIVVPGSPDWTKNWLFKLYRGVSSGCLRNQWDFTGASDDNMVAAIKVTDYDPDITDEDTVHVEAWNFQFMCYEGGSSNRLWKSDIFSQSWTMSGVGGIGFSIARLVDAELKGVVRKIFVPFGASTPRMMR